MAQTYTRQSSIADGDTITAALFNNEYNQLLNALVTLQVVHHLQDTDTMVLLDKVVTYIL